jgi:isochorismate hydrolase
MKTLPNKSTNIVIGRHECILVIIDVQDKLMPVIADRQSVLSNIIRLIKVCHLTDIPVVVTEQEKLGNKKRIVLGDSHSEGSFQLFFL